MNRRGLDGIRRMADRGGTAGETSRQATEGAWQSASSGRGVEQFEVMLRTEALGVLQVD